jgi:hypothetical protein
VCAYFVDKVTGTPAFRVAEAQAAAIVAALSGSEHLSPRYVKVGQSKRSARPGIAAADTQLD